VLYEPTQDLLASERTRTRGLYNVEAIRRDLQKHRDGLVDVTDALFNVAQVESWLALDGRGLARGGAPPPSADSEETGRAAVAGAYAHLAEPPAGD
jgi:hypothetical protein